MGIAVQCDECGALRHVSESLAGRTVRCKVCRGTISVPGGEDDLPAPPPRVTRRSKTRTRSRSSSDSTWSIGLLEVLYGLAALLIALAFTFDTQFGGSCAAFLIGIGLYVVGFYGAVIVARAEDFSERILYVLLPIYHFFYWAKYWEDTRRYVACCGIGFGLMCVSLVGLVLFLEQAPNRANASTRGPFVPRMASNDPAWNKSRAEMDARMKADSDRFWQEQRQQMESITRSAHQPLVQPPANNPFPEMKGPSIDLSKIGRDQQERLRELQQRASAGRPSFLPPRSFPSQPVVEQQPVSKDEQILRELAKPVFLPQLLPISRQVRGKFEPQVGMQVFVKWKDDFWYRAEVTEVVGEKKGAAGQKAKVRLVNALEPSDDEFGRDRVRLPNTPWPVIPVQAPEPQTAPPS